MSKCINAFNTYYYNEFNKMINDARVRNNKNMVIIYRKVAFSIAKYPFPILSTGQASMLEGVGESICKIFENMISCYKAKIKKENIDYITLAFEVNCDNELKPKTKRVKKKKKDEESSNKNSKTEANMLQSTSQKVKMKKNLVDIELYSSLWTTVISCYILYIQNEDYYISIDDIQAMSLTLSEQLKQINLNIKPSESKDFDEMKELNIIDTLESKNIVINGYLTKLASIELKKIGIHIIKDENNEINFSMYEPEKDEIPICDFSKLEDQEDKNILEKYTNFMKEDYKNEDGDNVIMLVDLREKGANNENFKNEILNIAEKNIKIEERQLSLGDFLWIYKDKKDNMEYVIDFIIERKTLNDLASSILDGRYTEQKCRLKNSFFTHIYYLFEGTTNLQTLQKISKSSINTAIYHTLNIHDINYIKTNSSIDTVTTLVAIDSNIRNCFSFLYDTDGNKVTYDMYVAINSKTKNSNIEQIFLMQLRLFDNCGAKNVEIIDKCFKTPITLYTAIKKCKDEGVSKDNMQNFFTIANYLFENKKEINTENLLYYLNNNENFKKIKKGLKSVKKVKKSVVDQILSFYGGYPKDDDDEDSKKSDSDSSDSNIDEEKQFKSKKRKIIEEIIEEKDDE